MQILKYISLTLAVLVLLICLFVLLAPQFGAKPSGPYLERIEASPEYTGEIFQNSPVVQRGLSFKVSMDVMWDMLRGAENRQPKQKLPSQHVQFDRSSGNHLTWFGHSTFLYETQGSKILFDPMLGDYASPIPGLVKRYDYDLPSSAKDLPFLDAVIISHDHYDHLDYGTVKALMAKVGVFVAPLGVGSHLRHWGVPDAQIVELDWHGSTTLKNSQINITAVPSQHFSGRAITDGQKTLWAAFIIENQGEMPAKVFFGGDSGYFPGFKDIGSKYGPFDLTLLDSGQYDDRWSVVHMRPEESVMAHRDLRGKVFMPIHWSAFTLALHPWKEPAGRAVQAAQAAHIDFVTPRIGQRFDVLKDRPSELWWQGIE